jgi:hypothetical protein
MITIDQDLCVFRLDDADVPQNSTEQVKFRQSIMALEAMLGKRAAEGSFEPGNYLLTHYFTPIDEKYGCCAYAREILLPKGHLIIGKIHKHPHLNFVMKGRLSLPLSLAINA